MEIKEGLFELETKRKNEIIGIQKYYFIILE
jgi:hypothetical protein